MVLLDRRVASGYKRRFWQPPSRANDRGRTDNGEIDMRRAARLASFGLIMVMALCVMSRGEAVALTLLKESCVLRGLEDLTLHNTDLLVAHGANGSLSVFNMDLGRTATVYHTAESVTRTRRFALFADTAVDPNGVIYATVFREHKIVVLNPKLEEIRTISMRGKIPGRIRNPIGIAYHDQKIYVAEYKNNRISVFTTAGRFVFSFGSVGSRDSEAPGGFHGPYDIEIRDGLLFVTDRENHRIQVFDLNGRFIRQFGKKVLNWPHNMSFDKAGNLYVADLRNNAVQIFDTSGGLKRSLKSGLTLHAKGIEVWNDIMYLTSWKSSEERRLCLRKLRIEN